MVFTRHPVDIANITQGWGELKTGGVTPNPYGTPIEKLVFNYGNYQPHGHDGWDYGCPIGTPVKAPGDIIIEWSGWGTDMPAHLAARFGFVHGPGAWPSGILICFRSAINPNIGGYVAHLSRSDYDTRLGARLNAGVVMGLSGNSGRSGGPHVHFSTIRFPVNYADPLYSRVNPGLYFAKAPTITPPKEFTLSEAAVKQIIKEVSANVTAGVNGYTGAIGVSGYTVGDVKHAGIGPVVEQNQREIRQNRAILANLVTALNRVAGGEAFDEAKLLDGIAKTVRETTIAATKEAIESIESSTTTTINIKPVEAL